MWHCYALDKNEMTEMLFLTVQFLVKGVAVKMYKQKCMNT